MLSRDPSITHLSGILGPRRREAESPALGRAELRSLVLSGSLESLLPRAAELRQLEKADSYGLFVEACRSGNADVARWLILTFGLARPRGLLFDRKFEKACKKGDLRLAKLRAERFGLTADDLERRGGWPCMVKACLNGHLGLASWLRSALRIELSRAVVHGKGSLFVDVCSAGHLEVARWLAAIAGAPGKRRDKAICGACSGGHLRVARWLRESFGASPDLPAENRSVFAFVCAEGYLDVAEWMASVFEVPRELVCRDGFCAFGEACARNQPDIARWLRAAFAVTQEEVLDNSAVIFRQACGGGSVALVRWLCRTFALTRENLGSALGYAFTDSCRWGQPEVSRWLREAFSDPIPIRDAALETILADLCERGDLPALVWFWEAFVAQREGALSRRNSRSPCGDDTFGGFGGPAAAGLRGGFNRACAGGHLEVTQWLADKFALTSEDLALEHSSAFIGACASGECWPESPKANGFPRDTHPGAKHLEVAQWLHTRFAVAREDVVAEENRLFRELCEAGDLEALRWLHGAFCYTRKEATARSNSPFRSACKERHLKVADWLVETFELQDADIRANCFEAFFVACRGGHLRITRWLGGWARNDDLEAAQQSAADSGHLEVVLWLEAARAGGVLGAKRQLHPAA